MTIKNLLSENNNYLSTDFITDRFNTDFYLPGTIVELFTPTGLKPIKLTDYVIDKVSFRLSEKYPLYTIKKYGLNEEGYIVDFNYSMVSHSMIKVKKNSNLSSVNVGTYEIDADKDKIYVSAMQVLDNKTFLWLEQIVYLNLDIMNNNPVRKMISGISIDNDLNVYYQLDKNTNSFYTYPELAPLLIYGDKDKAKLNLIQIKKIKE